MNSDNIDQERCSVSIKSYESLSNEMIQVEKKLVRRLDYIYVMPCLCLLIVVQLHLGKYLGAITILWGIVLGVTSASKNFTHLAVLRFLLGVFEAGVLSCAYMIVSRVYRRKEQAGRIGVIYLSGGGAIAIGGLLCYGIGHMEGVAQLRAWQWVMILLGSGTVAFGIVCYFLLIDDAKVIATSDDERKLIELRIKDNAVVATRKINPQQILEALKECRYYCFSAFSFFVSLQNGGLSVFGSIITRGFGFSNLNTILLGVPSGAAYCIFIFIAITCHNKFKNSMMYTGCGMLSISVVGLILVLVIPINQAKLIGLYICVAYIGALVLVMTSISNNVSGYTKKIFYNCSMVFFSAIGNFVGPQLMIPSQSPLYIGGLITYIGANFVCILSLLVARRTMSEANKLRQPKQKLENHNEESIDITDKQDDQFIYKL
ncbi:hypothetical protein INT47_013137 [Mucor saturninus]|uniref:Major facilitator superfamily (MFS) profile domain-containing protein n=1 Tax=Mucor saturninus TaxID=64648 RepID=A0A8H7V0L6_9FUNG|nr:hypothetical protein INT47_013137 [Mucor saturninus]